MNIFGITPEQLLGKPTLHVPINMIIQKMNDDGTVIGTFQTRQGNPLVYGSKKTHQLILGDAFIRPRLVAESDAFIGSGMSNLATRGFADIDKWIQDGQVLFLRDDCSL